MLLPLRQPVTAQTASRYSLTAAVADHGTVAIDRYREHLSADFATKDGHLYSDKAPGQPLWAVPAYALHRLGGGASGQQMSQEGYRGVWLSVLWSSVLPAALIAGGATYLLGRRHRVLAPAVGAVTVAGTLLLPFGSVLFGHVLAAALIAAAAVLALWPADPEARTGRIAASGALAGAAVVTEYAVLWLAAGLTLWVLWRHRLRAWAFVAGALPLALGLMAYLWAAFGSPFTPSYRYANLGDHTGNLGGIRPPNVDTLREVVLGSRGLLVLTPIVIVALVGLVILLMRRDDRLTHFAGFALFGFGVLFLLQIGWANPTGGHSAGPRYLIPALPLLAPGIAAAWERWPIPASLAAAWSAATMWLATNADPTLPVEREPALQVWFADLVQGEGVPALVPLWGQFALVLIAVGLVVLASSRLRRA